MTSPPPHLISPATSPPLDKSEFGGPAGQTWLYTGAECPPHRAVTEAVVAYMNARGNGPAGREFNARAEAACRSRLAAMLGGQPADIALLSNASHAISSTIRAVNPQPGENIVLTDLEYPSGALAALAQRKAGVEVRVVPHRNWDFSVSDIMARVDQRTRLVIASQVSYLSGARLDQTALYQELSGTSALLLSDATQALGVVPVRLDEADIVVSSTHKWLLAMHGAGIMALNPRRTAHLMPDTAGWRSVAEMFRPDRFANYDLYPDARRFELGYPSFATLHALAAATEILQRAGIEAIGNHVAGLTERLVLGLQDLDLRVLTPASRAGNVAWACESGEEMAEQLAARGILLWGGDGRVRASLHGFNECADVDRLLEALAELT